MSYIVHVEVYLAATKKQNNKFMFSMNLWASTEESADTLEQFALARFSFIGTNVPSDYYADLRAAYRALLSAYCPSEDTVISVHMECV